MTEQAPLVWQDREIRFDVSLKLVLINDESELSLSEPKT